MATLIVYPDSGEGGTTTDGSVQRNAISENLATIRSGAGTSTDTVSTGVLLAASGTTNEFEALRRCIATFDTSTLTNDVIINSASLSVYGSYKQDSLGGTREMHVVSATPASNNALVNSDYGQTGSTSFGSVSYANFSTSSYNDISLNSNGINNISKTGISKFGFRTYWDLNNSFDGTWAAFSNTSLFFYAAEDGTSVAPKLTITYSPIEWYVVIS